MALTRLIAYFVRLQSPLERCRAAQELAAELGIKDLLVFGLDVEIDIFLPAPGFAQTLQHGKAWQAFLRDCAMAGEATGNLPDATDAPQTVFGIADPARQCILAFIGGTPQPETLDSIKSLSALLGPKLVDERVALAANGHAMAARDANKKAAALNLALSINRHELSASVARAESELEFRRKAEKKLREADRSKDEFLAMLGHELRNPLAPINNAAALLRLMRPDDQPVRRASEIICRQVAHMTELIDDLLDVARVTRGLITLDNTILDIRKLVTEAIEQVHGLIETRRHKLEVHLPPEPAYVCGDRTRLVQVIANLINNAAKYTPKGGVLALAVEVQDHLIKLTVQDNGIGMNEDLLPHVFDLFRQGERLPDRSQGGLGLGLALVKSLVELQGGSVAAASGGAGQGSVFTISLPRRFNSDAHAAARPGEIQADPHVANLKVMVVDDNTDAALTTAMLLEAWGYQVMVEHSGKAALEHARADVPRVLLLDIGLPDMDGHELARRLRAAPETAGVMLIALTGYGQLGDREKSKAAGFDHHLVKPTDPVALSALLSSVS